MFTATITSKGQITIPVDVRQALGLDAGDQISFEEIAPGKFSFAPVKKSLSNPSKACLVLQRSPRPLRR